MTDAAGTQRNPWLLGQEHPPSGVPPQPGSAGAPVRVEPAALRRAAGTSRRLQGELRLAVGHAEPDTNAAARALSTECFGSGAALAQVLTWWKARWTSLDNRLGLTADRLEATAGAYRATDASAASPFKAP
ncbi:type VII secretion target [Kitasatospora sp. NPDC008115]|uniref:type VII secretion target n=1 Tax=Kitasatospora sp. NPDC008115 TaxID=3364022 RepID=UPI0036E8EF1A